MGLLKVITGLEYMNASIAGIRIPDLSARPFNLVAEHTFALQSAALYQAWTAGFDKWFAVPGSVIMTPRVNTAFFFETEFRDESDTGAKRHPHYGRFLRLIPKSLVEMTWMTGTPGTDGAETVVTVRLAPASGGTHLHLTHAGFPNAAARDRHSQAWPLVLTHMAERITNTDAR
jgi:uncharacterized protein YndB with AHSA1/START domain